MSRIVNINGNPYTTAGEDLALQKIKASLGEAIKAEVSGMRDLSGGDFAIDTVSFFEHIEIAYACGMACGKPHAITMAEQGRINVLLENFLEALADEIQSALARARSTGKGQSSIALDMARLYEIVQQAYYMGREDGGA